MSKPKRALDTVEGLDRRWSATKIRLLIDGVCLNDDDEMLIAESVYQQRIRCLDGFEDPGEGVLEHAQMVKAIQTIRDADVRHAMLLKVYAGCDEYEIEFFLQSKRAGHHLIDRGCELVRRHEKGAHARKAAQKSIEDAQVVCWRCMRNPVEDPGAQCEECSEKKLPGRPQGTVTPVDEWSLEKLVETQETADDHIPGSRSYDGKVHPVSDVNQAGMAQEWQTPYGIGGGRKRREMDPRHYQ